jgi:hypothetical protein
VNRQGTTSLRKILLTSKCGEWSRCTKPNLANFVGKFECQPTLLQLWGIMPVLGYFCYFMWFFSVAFGSYFVSFQGEILPYYFENFYPLFLFNFPESIGSIFQP